MTFYRISCLCFLLFAIGCGGEVKEFHEVKHPRELLRVSEVNQFLRIVNRLPDNKLPELPSLFAEVPEWERDRELSISGLVKESKRKLGRPWQANAVLARLKNNRRLEKLLENENLSLRQFLGLAESISMAVARIYSPSREKLQDLVRDGQHEISELSHRDQVFSGLLPEEQFEVLRQAAWLARMDRASDLLDVPEENVAFMQRHLETISRFVPDEVQSDPMLEVIDELLVYGIPFVETPQTGSDGDLVWSVESGSAIIGREK